MDTNDERRVYEPLPTEEAREGFEGLAFTFAVLLLVVVAGMWLLW